MNIYADDSIVYQCTSKNQDDPNFAANFFSDLALTAQWEINWLVIYSTSKNKLVSFHHHCSGPKFSPFTLNSSTLFEHLLDIKMTPDLLKWNSSIHSIIKDAGKMVGLLYYSRKYLTLSDMLYFYKKSV